MNTIDECYNSFIQTYVSFNEMLRDSTILYQQNVGFEGHTFSKKIYNAIVEHCFMQIFLAWENFLENSFILYLYGCPDLQGNAYVRYGIPKDRQHAYNMVKGTKNYPDWTNINDVKYLAKTYFENGGPYSIIENIPIEFEDIKVIRNRISHISEKSTKAFERLLAKTIVQSTNIDISDFLMMFKDDNQTYFSYYMDFLKGYVEAICNKSISFDVKEDSKQKTGGN